MSFPVIDISTIDEPESQLSIANEITNACKQWGFLLIKGHEIRAEDITEMFRLGKAFFDLPEEQKEPWPIDKQYIGYNGSLKDRARDDKMSMWLSGVPGALAANSGSLPPFWREHTNKVEAFKHKCHGLVIKMLVCFALAMGLPDKNFFADAHNENSGNGNGFRMIEYPARNASPGEVTRMSPHTDSGSVTLLFQDCAGLEVESPSGEWVKAPCLADHILVNLGDALAFWSGAQLKATLHRVTFNGVPFDRARQTMAYFGSADPATVLQPLNNGSAEGLKGYNANGIEVSPGITVGEYQKKIMEKIYGASVKQENSSSGAVATAA